jgi:hypothetical protein
VKEERALVSVIAPTASSGVRIEHWRYTAAFSRGPSRPWHTVFLNSPGIRYEGRIGDRHVRRDGAQHSNRHRSRRRRLRPSGVYVLLGGARFVRRAGTIFGLRVERRSANCRHQ